MKYIYTVCYLLFVITEPEPRLEDLTGVELYVALCERIGIVPLSCVKNNIHKTHFHMPHRGIGAKGVQALAPPIAVSIQCILTNIFCFRCVLIFRDELWEKLWCQGYRIFMAFMLLNREIGTFHDVISRQLSPTL